MEKKSNHIAQNKITTEDLALSAYLKMKGYQLVKSNQNNGNQIFTFEIGNDKADQLKLEFINSEIIKYYNELRNLKKLV